MGGKRLNLIINIFIWIAISVLFCLLFLFMARFFARKYKNVENIRLGSAICSLLISAVLNGFLVCWLLITYGYLPQII